MMTHPLGVTLVLFLHSLIQVPVSQCVKNFLHLSLLGPLLQRAWQFARACTYCATFVQVTSSKANPWSFTHTYTLTLSHRHTHIPKAKSHQKWLSECYNGKKVEWNTYWFPKLTQAHFAVVMAIFAVFSLPLSSFHPQKRNEAHSDSSMKPLSISFSLPLFSFILPSPLTQFSLPLFILLSFHS